MLVIKGLTTKNTENHQECTKDVSDDEALQAVLQLGGVEIHEQPQAFAAHAEIGQNSRLMGWDNGGDCLDFQNDGVRDDDIRAEAQWGGSPVGSNALCTAQRQWPGFGMECQRPPVPCTCIPGRRFPTGRVQSRDEPRWPGQ